jgi:hypothetical protein
MTTYALPGFGVTPRSVNFNSKCSGCFHHEPDRGVSGLCLVDLQPAVCGDGSLPRVSYAPVDKGYMNVLPASTMHHEIREPAGDGTSPAGRLGSPEGDVMSTEVLNFRDLGIDLDSMTKAVVDPAREQAQFGCGVHQNRQSGGYMSLGAPFSPLCTCAPVSKSIVARALWALLPPRGRASATFEQVEEHVSKALGERVQAPGKPPKYLPGVHDPKGPTAAATRPAGDSGARLGMPPKKPVVKAEDGDTEPDVAKGLAVLEALAGE